jgi:hypothetical protein
MKETETSYQCLNCSRPEIEIPLVSLRFAGNQTWICSQCLPVLIHQPQKLASRLAQAETFPATPPLE